MTKEQQLYVFTGIISALFTFAGVLTGIIFSGFKKTQEQHADKLSKHDTDITKLKETQYLKIEQLDKAIDELKTEVHELRQTINAQVAKENQVLNQMHNTLLRMESKLKSEV
jgi:TolA-binding protein